MPNRMEEIASKGMGKIKATKARVKGLKGVFRQLAEEHGEVSALLQRVSASSDPAVRKRLFPKIRTELLSHERAERSELYPLLEKHAETRDIVKDHNREADQMETLLDELEAQSFDSAQWGNTFERLVDVVKHHTSEEEDNYFPKAQKIFGEQRTESLKKDYLKAKQSVAKEISA